MNKKKMLLLGLLLIVGIVFVGITEARADYDVWDSATLSYQNLAGVQQPNIYTNSVYITVQGITLSVTKYQKVRRLGIEATQIFGGAGDSVTYRFVINNATSSTATNVVLTDTLTFYNAGIQNNTFSYVAGSAWPDRNASLQDGPGTVTNLEYWNSQSVWVTATSATIPNTAGLCRGIRWTFSHIEPVAGNAFPGAAAGTPPYGEADTNVWFTVRIP